MGDESPPTTGVTGRTPERLGGASSEHGAGCADDRTRANFVSTGLEPAPDLAATSFFLVASRARKDGPAAHLAHATRPSRVRARHAS